MNGKMELAGMKILLRKFVRLRPGLLSSLRIELLEIAKGVLHIPRKNGIADFMKFCQFMALDPHFLWIHNCAEKPLQRQDCNMCAWLREPLCFVSRMNWFELLLCMSQRASQAKTEPESHTEAVRNWVFSSTMPSLIVCIFVSYGDF